MSHGYMYVALRKNVKLERASLRLIVDTLGGVKEENPGGHDGTICHG